MKDLSGPAAVNKQGIIRLCLMIPTVSAEVTAAASSTSDMPLERDL